MKNNSINNKVNYVPNMAEPRFTDFDDLDNPLKPLDIIPEGKENFLKTEAKPYEYDGEKHMNVSYILTSEIKNPSDVREEQLVRVVVPSGVHPITFLKENGIGVDIEKTWIFMNNDVADVLRKMPYKFHQATVAYGEFFRFENFDTISLQKVKYFPDWNVVLEGKIDEKVFGRPEIPQIIIEVIMEK